jgi:hypothetical protein
MRPSIARLTRTVATVFLVAVDNILLATVSPTRGIRLAPSGPAPKGRKRAVARSTRGVLTLPEPRLRIDWRQAQHQAEAADGGVSPSGMRLATSSVEEPLGHEVGDAEVAP